MLKNVNAFIGTGTVINTSVKLFALVVGVPIMIYYSIYMHQQEAFKEPSYTMGDFPLASKLFREVISLPIHTYLENY